MSPGTTLHSVRVADDLWRAAMAEARRNNESVSDVIRRALEEYVAAPG